LDDSYDERVSAFSVDGIGIFSTLILDEEAALHILTNIKSIFINFLVKILANA